jgi:hypothetical protein
MGDRLTQVQEAVDQVRRSKSQLHMHHMRRSKSRLLTWLGSSRNNLLLRCISSTGDMILKLWDPRIRSLPLSRMVRRLPQKVSCDIGDYLSKARADIGLV